MKTIKLQLGLLAALLLVGAAKARAGVVEDAFAATRALAEAGDAPSQYILALSYESGQGLPQNAEAACYWARRAAEQGQPEAELMVGRYYQQGFGVARDAQEGRRWIELAASQGLAEALELLQADAGERYIPEGILAQAD